jgi:hypothetical protein
VVTSTEDLEWWEDPTIAAHYVLSVAGETRARTPGGFAELLIRAMFHADRQQRARLALAYPVLVAAITTYKEEDHGYLDLEERAGLR